MEQSRERSGTFFSFTSLSKLMKRETSDLPRLRRLTYIYIYIYIYIIDTTILLRNCIVKWAREISVGSNYRFPSLKKCLNSKYTVCTGPSYDCNWSYLIPHQKKINNRKTLARGKERKKKRKERRGKRREERKNKQTHHI